MLKGVSLWHSLVTHQRRILFYGAKASSDRAIVIAAGTAHWHFIAGACHGPAAPLLPSSALPGCSILPGAMLCLQNLAQQAQNLLQKQVCTRRTYTSPTAATAAAASVVPAAPATATAEHI